MQEIVELLKKALKDLSLPDVAFSVTHPKEETHGDYSANVAMILAKQEGKNPRELAEMIVEKLQDDAEMHRLIEKVEVAGPGFINFYLQSSFFMGALNAALTPDYGTNRTLAGQKTVVEFTDPNPFKEFHIGHLMSNTIGESLARLFAANGAEVKRANYQGDVGLHVAKSIWGWQKKMEEDGKKLTDLQGLTLKEQVNYLGVAYAYGATTYEEDEAAKAEMNAMNKAIYLKTDPIVNELYTVGRQWSLDYFETIYARLGTKFDHYFFESEAGPIGLQVIEEGLAKGVLEVGEEGAVVFKGEKFGLHTRVFRNKMGLPTYEGKELGLAKTKYAWYPYDRSYIVTANEISEYFKVLRKVLTLLYPELGERTTHLAHGMMKLTTGKMSSRTGKVVTGESLLNELRSTVLTKMGGRSFDFAQDKELIADQVAVAALKYTVLKQAIGGDIVYDPEKMTNLEGDTGPYIQYTYVRTQSLLRKANGSDIGNRISDIGVQNAEETSILRWMYRYPEVVAAASREYAPHLVASYLYELAARFNTFYNQHQVVGHPGRLLMTQAVGNILQSGLQLLGIQTPAEM